MLELLQRRGPDNLGQATRSLPYEGHGEVYLTFVSTVLSLRGSKTVTQPRRHPGSSDLLCWNGEAWLIDGKPPVGNDTAAIFELLSTQTALVIATGNVVHSLEVVATSLSTVAGPYGFLFYCSTAQKLFFGRDFLGRRSLLYKISDGELVLSSVTSGLSDEGWKEVEADGVYCIDLRREAASAPSTEGINDRWGNFTVSKHPYHSQANNVAAQKSSVGPQDRCRERSKLMAR